MFKKISHVGIAVKDIQASTELFRKLFGKNPDRTEDLPAHQVKTALFDVGSSSIELTEATDPDSPIAKFIGKRGEGVHHISFVVDDIEKELARLKRNGFQLIDEHPRLGAEGYYVAFLHPTSTNGVLVELSQKK
jgi:methylmalonyl-CoA/ethylmalonyl-CoA epimerase